MAVSKVVLGNETLIDLTGDSVSSENLLQGETAHGANGEEVIGGVVVTPMYTGTKAAIEEAIALGQIPEDAVVNITDDEETSSFQTQINEINSSLGGLKFGKDGEGNYGYFGDDDVLIPFSGDATINSVNQASYTIEEDGKYIVTAIGNASYKPIIYVNNVQQTPISETTQSGFSTYVSIYELELKKSDVLTTHWYLLHVIKC